MFADIIYLVTVILFNIIMNAKMKGKYAKYTLVNISLAS